MEAPPERAVAVAMPVDDPPQIDPALEDELGQIDHEADLADDGANTVGALQLDVFQKAMNRYLYPLWRSEIPRTCFVPLISCCCCILLPTSSHLTRHRCRQ